MSNIVIKRKVDVRLKAFLLHSSAESNNFKWSCELCKKRFSPHVRLRNYLDATREFSSYFHWHNYRAFRFLDWRKKEHCVIQFFDSVQNVEWVSESKPNWIRKKWWLEGEINDTDYMTLIQLASITLSERSRHERLYESFTTCLINNSHQSSRHFIMSPFFHKFHFRINTEIAHEHLKTLIA